jgi:Beta galactosidase small chain
MYRVLTFYLPFIWSNSPLFIAFRFQNYPDRKAAAEMGFYETTSSCVGYTYIVPSENGSRSDCRWVAFRGVDGAGICIASERSDGFSFSSLLHSASELNAAAHTCDLETRKDGEHPIHCSIDHRLMGLGGDTRQVSMNVAFVNDCARSSQSVILFYSWYPVVYPQFLVKPSEEFKYCIWLLPLEAEANPAIAAGNL